VSFLYNYEYGTLKPVDVTIRKGQGRKENNGEDEPIQGTYGNVTMKPL
jgi:hypothetical protein